MRTLAVKGRAANQVEHVLCLTREQHGKQAQDNAADRDDNGGDGKVPRQRRKFRLAAYNRAKANPGRVEERVQRGVPLPRNVQDGVRRLRLADSSLPVFCLGHSPRFVLVFVPVPSCRHAVIIPADAAE